MIYIGQSRNVDRVFVLPRDCYVATCKHNLSASRGLRYRDTLLICLSGTVLRYNIVKNKPTLEQPFQGVLHQEVLLPLVDKEEQGVWVELGEVVLLCDGCHEA